MAEQRTLRIQQNIQPSYLERMIADELRVSVGPGAKFDFIETDREGIVTVTIPEEVLASFVSSRLVEVVQVDSPPGMESSWNNIKSTYVRDQNADVEDIF